jgi:pyruvate dehydrogenase E2 component (dihydrolipoamide acetyltransferase)
MSATGELMEVTVPDIGDFDDVPVIEVLVAVGDTVAVEDPLVTLESDKATMDVPAPAAGVVREVFVAVGDHVSEGSRLLALEPAETAPEPAPAAAGTPATAAPREAAAEADTEQAAAQTADGPATPPPAEPAVDTSEGAAPSGNGNRDSAPGAEAARPTEGRPVYASPSVRRLARELGIDLQDVTGSGRGGRITVEDIRTAGENGRGPAPSAGAGVAGQLGLSLAPWPKVDFEKFGPVQRVARSRIQMISAPNLARNWVMIPHVTHNDEADITELEAWRRQLNEENARDSVKVTMVSFLVAASVATLKAFPIFNSSLDGEELVLRRYYNIGFAADTPGGLVVPVIKSADTKGLLDVARELTELSSRAREGKLGPGDMSGGTFTISSLGGIGGTSFTPIINAPEVAILGATRSAMKPLWDAATNTFVPRLMLPLSLSYDHRVIDGAAAARFVSHLVRVLTDLRRALL